MKRFQLLLIVFITSLMVGFSWGGTPSQEVVVYTSHDQIHSEPILNLFQAKTGIEVKAVYDVEASKTTGIVNRLIAEKNHPRCDVFWNNENSRTIVLKNKGVLAPYRSSSAASIPALFKDPEGYWTGFGARARVIVYNTDILKPEQAPHSIDDFTKPQWRGQFAIANPLFGTTATHAAALFVLLGDAQAKQYFLALQANDVVIAAGNSVVKDLVASGEVKAGLTDTDDVNVARLAGDPVGMIYPDQNGMGTLVIPNTVCLVKNCPHPETGRKLIDFLLTKEVESKLAFSKAAQMPVRSDVAKPDNIPSVNAIKVMKVKTEEIAKRMEAVSKWLMDVFLR